MKNRLVTSLILFTLTMFFVNMAYKSSAYERNNLTSQKVENYGCLDRYLNLTSFAWDIMNVAMASYAKFLQSDADALIECNQLATDSYLAMHAAADAAYDRCNN